MSEETKYIVRVAFQNGGLSEIYLQKQTRKIYDFCTLLNIPIINHQPNDLENVS